jgi:hypothetical protein
VPGVAPGRSVDVRVVGLRAGTVRGAAATATSKALSTSTSSRRSTR